MQTGWPVPINLRMRNGSILNLYNSMVSFVVGGTVEVTQIGDVRIKEQTDLVLVEDEGNVSLLENKTTIAEVLQGDGTTTVLVNVKCTVRATGDQPIPREQLPNLIPTNISSYRVYPILCLITT